MTAVARNLRRAALIGSLLIGASPALAEVVLNRGNAGEPQTLDQAHTSINIEEFILKDLYEGLTIYDAKGSYRVLPRAGRFPRTAPSTRSSCAITRSGLTVRR
jgi:ABC-type oligopeptide transport system substrate-binding subunit